MRPRLLTLLILLTLAGCAHELPAASGPVFAFSPAAWTPTAADMAVQP